MKMNNNANFSLFDVIDRCLSLSSQMPILDLDLIESTFQSRLMHKKFNIFDGNAAKVVYSCNFFFDKNVSVQGGSYHIMIDTRFCIKSRLNIQFHSVPIIGYLSKLESEFDLPLDASAADGCYRHKLDLNLRLFIDGGDLNSALLVAGGNVEEWRGCVGG